MAGEDWEALQQWLLQTLTEQFSKQEDAIRRLLLEESVRGVSGYIGTPNVNIDHLMASANLGTQSVPLKPKRESVTSATHHLSEPESGEESSQEMSPGRAISKKEMSRLGKHILSEKLAPDSPFRAFVKRSLDSYLSVVVIVNLFFIILTTEFAYSQAQYSLGISDLPWQGISEHTFEITEYIFCAIYLLDVTIRVFVLRKEWYYDHIEGWMYLNMFDALLVAANLVELIALPVLFAGDQQHAATIRVIKLVRIVRTLRIFKTVSLFRQLRILVGTCIASVGALFWSMILLLVLMVGFALAMCQALQIFVLDTGANLEDRLAMYDLYGSFAKAFYTTFELTFSGSWPLRVRPITEKVSPWYAIPFLTYIALVVFAVIRIVTALFLKETLTSAANDADMVLEDAVRSTKDYQVKIEGLFHLADNDGDGTLSYEEFHETMTLPSVMNYLKSMDLTVHDCKPLFELLDDGDGKVTITEFCKGLSKVRGQAKAIDFVILQRETAKLLKEARQTRREVKRTAAGLLQLSRVVSPKPREADLNGDAAESEEMEVFAA
ncbi:unnamed protein product [Effrenium voratum]|uniref:EF-hand domain-containing protein n=1 Tax=Effrenium voratum TaxID=2562239 RepID=A0AA36N825_9DINO|nr:unnamed protein product [Effrenium voratum]CAJ1419568.1 unnamed protein product [Effrenium voratum]